MVFALVAAGFAPVGNRIWCDAEVLYKSWPPPFAPAGVVNFFVILCSRYGDSAFATPTTTSTTTPTGAAFTAARTWEANEPFFIASRILFYVNVLRDVQQKQINCGERAATLVTSHLTITEGKSQAGKPFAEPFALKPNFPFGSTATRTTVLEQSVKNELTSAGTRQMW